MSGSTPAGNAPIKNVVQSKNPPPEFSIRPKQRESEGRTRDPPTAQRTPFKDKDAVPKVRKDSFGRHKENLAKAIKDLESLGNSITTMAKLGGLANEAQPEPLKPQRFVEEQVDYTIAAKEKVQEEQEKAYRWVEKTIDRIYHIASILTLIASLLFAFASYMFVHLPDAIYSHHVLTEIFLVRDKVIERNGFAKSFGIQMITPLPAAIAVMFSSIVYLVYLVEYPKQGKVRATVRIVLCLLIELYLGACGGGYCYHTFKIDSRLNQLFEKDKKTLKGEDEPLYYLGHSQEYFGCCGFKDKSEWQENLNFKDKSKHNYKTSPPQWPLSCCDPVSSEIACFSPVTEKLTYDAPPEDGKKKWEREKKENVQRIHTGTCHESEKTLSESVASLVIILVVAFLVLSSVSFWMVWKVSTIVTSMNLEIKLKPQFVDYF